MTHQRRRPAFVALSLMNCFTAAVASAQPLEEVVVKATLSTEDPRRISYSILDQERVLSRNAQHLEDLLSAAANVNSASGASRGRFFQIRGIGERSQFVEPINASVGMQLDGIDLTGIGAAGLLFDLEQVEVLRGPQGTLFGASALAGLIHLTPTSVDAPAVAELSSGIEQYGGRQLGIRLGGAVADGFRARLSAQTYQSDGFIDNTWLGRDDTSGRDETQLRTQLGWRGDDNTVDFLWQHLDVANGYDSFSLDNTRDTLSDQPGTDALALDAIGLRWRATRGTIESVLQLSAVSSDSEYSYDEDWAYVGIAPDLEYSSFDRYRRKREMRSLEWRLAPSESTATLSWVAGAFLRREDETLDRDYTFLEAGFESALDIETAAFFGQLDTALSDRLQAFAGLRWEQRDSDYNDSAQVNQKFQDTYWSGQMGFRWQLDDRSSLYLAVARGVRAGGVNAGLLASIDALPEAAGVDLAPLGFFDGESLLSTELGWQFQSSDGAMTSRLALFNMQRSDQQTRGSVVIPRPDGSTAFIDYTDNAARGSNRGLEWEATWRPTRRLTVRSAVGLLDATFNDYIAATGEDLDGREQPHAPSWQYAADISYAVSEHVTGSLEVTGMDSFLFSDRHDVRSGRRNLINASINWHNGKWRATLWGRNLTNQDYFVRGFGSFGNDPRKGYITEAYRQFGEPRVMGVSLAYDFAAGD